MNRTRLLWIISPLLLIGAACTDQSPSIGNPQTLEVRAARGPGDIVVSSTNPDSATQGQTLDVVVNGSGFVSGATATWALAGTADSLQVRTNSTRYVSSRQLVANITISSAATVARWDVIVTAGSKGGIGTETFAIKATGHSADPVSAILLLSNAATSNFRGDGLSTYLEGDGSSRYKELECGVHVHLWNAPAASGDVTFDSFIHGGAKPKCTAYPRKTVVKFERVNADGTVTPEGSETVTIFVNVNKIHHSEAGVMSVGGPWEERNMLIDPPAGKCDQIRFRPILANGAATGADAVEVRRTSLDTWEVRSKADSIGPNGETIHNDKAWCDLNGALYHVPFAITVKSLTALTQ